MRLTDTQQKAILEISVKRAWHRRRKFLRRIFLACQDDGYGISGYHHILEEAIAMSKRTAEAIAILEKD